MANHDQADVTKAVSAGNAMTFQLDSTAALKTNVINDNNNNIINNNNNNNNNDKEDARMIAHDILLSLPGINVHNFRDVMNAVNSLSDLLDMSEESMCQLIGSVNGKKLFAFIIQYH
jgi:ERCC4-type nuclease